MQAHGRRLVTVAATAAALLVAGCGEDEFANEQRPPAPVVVAASITPGGVDVSPARLGAGPVEVVVTNLTDAAQQLTIAARGEGGLRQQTPRINPDSTASLKIDLDPDQVYEFRTGADDDIRAATLRVGDRRPSAQDQLLQP